MKVLHLGKYLPPHPGGIERFLAELMPALRRDGVRSAALVHAEPDAPRPRCRRQFGAAAVRTPVLAELAFAPISPDWACRLDRLIRRWRPDVLHLHLPNPSAFWALALPSARRLPWLVHWHADVPVDALDARLRLLYRAYRPLETAVLRRAHRIVATSEAYADSSPALARWRDKVAVVPLGLADLPLTRPAAPFRPGEDLRLIFVGRFSYYKGLPVLVEAVSRVENVSLLLVGDGEQRPALQRRVETLGVSSRIRFAGALSDDALAGAYAQADVLCLPSIERSEAFGLVLLEAMRAGVAAIATAVPGSGMAEVLDHGRAGLVVPPDDAAALAAAIVRLRDDPVLRRRLAAAGRARFQTHYRIEQVSAQLAALYRALAAAR